jgi:hypothetical protein
VSPADPLNAFLGDYTSIGAFRSQVVVAWTETAAGATRAKPETIIKVGSADFN